LFLSLSGLLL